jgi:hypothetical protein
MDTLLSVRDRALRLLREEQSLENFYREIIQGMPSLENRAILRDMLLQKEMNELLLRRMFHL